MFVQVIEGEVADGMAVQGALDRWLDELAPRAMGWLGITGGITAEGRLIMLVRFDTAEHARRNNDRPAQGEWWDEFTAGLAGAPTVHDCSEVFLMGEGGSDAAGFVQVMVGGTNDAEAMRELARQAAGMDTGFRPDVLGGLIAVHDDGSGFTQAVYFTSEEEAREGEQQEPPPEMGELLGRLDELTEELRYLDLSDPWLISP